MILKGKEGCNIRYTIQYSGFKRDWIVLMPGKCRKLLTFGNMISFLWKFCQDRGSSNIQNDRKSLRGDQRYVTISYLGFKQDWIVVIPPPKYRKLMIFWKNNLFFETFYHDKRPRNVNNVWKRLGGDQLMPNQ